MQHVCSCIPSLVNYVQPDVCTSRPIAMVRNDIVGFVEPSFEKQFRCMWTENFDVQLQRPEGLAIFMVGACDAQALVALSVLLHMTRHTDQCGLQVTPKRTSNGHFYKCPLDVLTLASRWLSFASRMLPEAPRWTLKASSLGSRWPPKRTSNGHF